ncbi:hypothetical protein [Streptomyces sp. NPDC059786]|uniref:hypothetical protein n=1 Tax=Streptomyces sp. NPDC059786 TaxID=3346946 RepID=UPI0036486AA5
MTVPGGAQRPPNPRETAAGLADLQGYLMAQATVREAQVRATAFADALPWLTTAEREDVVRRYADDDIARTRAAWQSVAHRADELRGEYTDRYDQLRRRLLRRHALALLLTATVLVAAGTLLGLAR